MDQGKPRPEAAASARGEGGSGPAPKRGKPAAAGDDRDIPCLGLCDRDPETGVCTGCGRDG
jgi:hypothetical protein